MYGQDRSGNRMPGIQYKQYLYQFGSVATPGVSRLPKGPLYRRGSSATHDSSSGPWGGSLDGGPQTMEQVIARGYFAVPREEPETALLADKRRVSWLGLDDAIRQIRSRYDMYHENVVELDEAVCEADNAVFRQEAAQGFPADQRQWSLRDKRVESLEEERRSERVKLWRDVARVRQTLPEAAGLYLAAYRRISLLDDPRGDAV